MEMLYSGPTLARMVDAAAGREELLQHALERRRVVVTRGGMAGELLVRRLEALGASVLYCPTISFAPPLDTVAFLHALANVAEHDWIVFTSANAVQSVAQALRTLFRTHAVQLPPIAVVGRATAAAVESFDWHVAFMSAHSSGGALASELPARVGSRVFLPRADIASADVPNVLRDRGCVVNEVIAYRTLTNVSPENIARLRASDGVDALTFTSPSTVQGFMDAAQMADWNPAQAQRDGRLVVVCIGDTTAEAVRQRGLVPSSVAADASIEALIDALAHAVTQAQTPAPH